MVGGPVLGGSDRQWKEPVAVAVVAEGVGMSL